VISTFGAMCAPDHAGAAAELVRVCRPGGRVLMTTWVNDGFVGEMLSSPISRELVAFEFVAAFRDLLTRSNPAEDDGAAIESTYFLITADR
jgi:hypothetical protein